MSLSTLKTPKKTSQARKSQKTPKKRSREPEWLNFEIIDGPLLSSTLVDIPLHAPDTSERQEEPKNTPKKSAERNKILELLQDETLRDSIIKDKKKA